MPDTPPPESSQASTPAGPQPRFSVYRSWLSLTGIVIGCASLFSFLLLFTLDALTHSSNPYLGILTYIASPAFLILGLGLVGFDWVRFRRNLHRRLSGEEAFFVEIDFARPRDRRNLVFFVLGTMAFLMLSALGSYQTYHFTESVTFCGEVCHAVMKPEYTTYQNGSHARVDCVDCHIGSGATWYVKSKLSGLRQVYYAALGTYSRPIPTPIHNLRPAQDTCEQCHWPKKFIGNIDRTYEHFLADDDNTPFAVRLSLKVGGGDPALGQVGGIHWHMNVANKVEFISEGEDHLKIPYVRLTRQDGGVEEYFGENITERPAGEAHHMDCIDCHTRPAHRFTAPNDAMDLALAVGRVDKSIPGVRLLGSKLLATEYPDSAAAKAAIAEGVAKAIKEPATVASVTTEIQRIYEANFFPEMKATWAAYPNQIGHKDWPGCFRCHDGKHATKEGKKITADCNACHTILAQGKGDELLKVAPAGLKFDHPVGDASDSLCSECHNGAPIE